MEAVEQVTTPAESTLGATQRKPKPARQVRVLTFSSIETFSRCQHEYELRYERLLVPADYSPALAIGAGFHRGIEVLHLRGTLAGALAAASVEIEEHAAKARAVLDDLEAAALSESVRWDAAKTRGMVRAWHDRYVGPATANGGGVPYVDCDREAVEVELALEAPLRNPTTGRPSRSFLLGGRLDAVVRRRGATDSGWWLLETKTTSEALDSFVEAMRFSLQPSIYQTLAMEHLGDELGPPLGTMLDICVKPAVRPKKTETPTDFEQRVVETYAAEPDRYFARLALPLDEARRREAIQVAWRTAEAIRSSLRHGFLAKAGPACRGAFGPCKYMRMCRHGDLSGFVQKVIPNEELTPRRVS
ncbi:MAG: PD-(D/E)XK nuclease family protein [Deltaproteobacteria bacterium]|nr:PD-(D/E)XK nuclease family protein [Deltaproteobacteria bacterium]